MSQMRDRQRTKRACAKTNESRLDGSRRLKRVRDADSVALGYEAETGCSNGTRLSGHRAGKPLTFQRRSHI